MSIDLRQLKEIIQSSNINVLIGAGASRPFMPVLGNIENAIKLADGNDTIILEQLRQYFSGVMMPTLNIIDNGENLSATRTGKATPSDKERFDLTYEGYRGLLESVSRILLKRKTTLLNKQINIFTTNIDVFMEKILEDSNFEYNDGFSGNVRPYFQTSNFYKSIYQTSAHFSNISEIPVFNLFKLHGSLSWELDYDKEKIVYSKLNLIKQISSCLDNNVDFKAKYDELQIVNPTKNKFRETVMGVTHYEMLRMFSNELEKENSVLFVIGFSMTDEHIREITKRAANSNPTLKIYLFCYSDGKTKTDFETWFQDMRYQNIEIVVPEENTNYDINTINSRFFATILDKKREVEDSNGSQD